MELRAVAALLQPEAAGPARCSSGIDATGTSYTPPCGFIANTVGGQKDCCSGVECSEETEALLSPSRPLCSQQSRSAASPTVEANEAAGSIAGVDFSSSPAAAIG